MGLTRQQVLQVSVLLFGCLLSELNYTLLAPALPALVEAVVIPLNAFFLGKSTTRRLFAGSFLLFARIRDR